MRGLTSTLVEQLASLEGVVLNKRGTHRPWITVVGFLIP